MSKAHFFDLDKEWETLVNYFKSDRQPTLVLRSMHPVIRIVLFISLVLVSSGGTAPGQEPSASPAKPNPVPTPIPLGKVALEAQSAVASLQAINASVSKDQSSADSIAQRHSDH
jgi:hypothetical protein